MLGGYPSHNRYNWAKGLIWACMFWGLISALIEAYGLRLVRHVDDAEKLTLDTFESAVQTTGIIQTVLLLAAGLTFLNCWSKSRKNLQKFGAVSERTNTNTAQLSWIIPIVSLWVPYQHTQEMSTSAGKVPPTSLPWCIAWLLYGVSGRVASRLYKNAEDPTGILHALQVSLLSELTLMAAGFWLLPVMQAVQQRQSRLAAQQSAAKNAATPQGLTL